jgi:transcriptional regulator NrdR family protein
MRCPSCDSTQSEVADTRLIRQAYMIRRKRKCRVCERVWTTLEVSTTQLDMISRDVGLLRSRITKALEHFNTMKDVDFSEDVESN